MPVANKITCSRSVPCNKGYCDDIETTWKNITRAINRLFSFSIRCLLDDDVIKNRRTIYTEITPTAIEITINMYILIGVVAKYLFSECPFSFLRQSIELHPSQSSIFTQPHQQLISVIIYLFFVLLVILNLSRSFSVSWLNACSMSYLALFQYIFGKSCLHLFFSTNHSN